MRVVTARLLWRYIKYAILAIFIVAAVLTPSTDPWNQTVFAMPMIALYVISIGIAWLAAPKDGSGTPDHEETKLRLVIGAMVVNQARRQVGARRRAPGAA
jgi:Sec-independent protein secretion pathway component TatC